MAASMQEMVAKYIQNK